MATCPGKIAGRQGTHQGPVYRCNDCRSVGCRDEKCSNSNFNAAGRCQSCGKYNHMSQI